MTDPAEYRLTFKAQSSDVPPEVRLRRLLKYALRVCGLKCVSVEDVPASPGPAREPPILPPPACAEAGHRANSPVRGPDAPGGV